MSEICVREHRRGACRFRDAGNPKCTAGPGRTCIETSAEEARQRLIAAAICAHHERKAAFNHPRKEASSA